jgi:AcrR family transcriptional regulator
VRKSPEKKQERERVQMTLMRATLELAEVHGFSGLGLREISREAGIAPTSFYRHFADVEELGLGIIERLVRPTIDPVVGDVSRAVAEGGDPIAALVHGLLESTVKEPALTRFVLAQRSGSHASFRRDLEVELGRLLDALRPALPPGTPDRAPGAALADVLLGCGSLLDVEPENRDARRAEVEPSLLEAARWLLHQPSARE